MPRAMLTWYLAQGYFAQAEPLFKRSIAIEEKALGPDSPKLVSSLKNLAALYKETDREQEAEPLEERAAAIEATKH